MPGPIGGPSEPNLDPVWKAFYASAPANTPHPEIDNTPPPSSGRAPQAGDARRAKELRDAYPRRKPEETIAAHLTSAIQTMLKARIPFFTEEQERRAYELGEQLKNSTGADLIQANMAAWPFAVKVLSQLMFTPESDMDRLYEHFGGKVNDQTSALTRLAIRQHSQCNELSSSHTAERVEAMNENATHDEINVIETRQTAAELAMRVRLRDEWWTEAKRLAPGIELPGHGSSN